MVVSALSYGNWITHGSQIEEDAAAACVKAALDAGITTFDTADVYAMGRAESVLGRALKGVRRDSIEIFTKVYWPTGPNPNNRGLRASTSWSRCMPRSSGCRPTTSTCSRPTGSTTRPRWRRRCGPSTTSCARARSTTSASRSGRPTQIEDALRLADDMGFDRIVSNQPQYSLLWRVIEAEVVPLCEKEGVGQIVWSPLAQGILTGKYLPGASAPPEGSRATGPEGGEMSWLLRDEVLEPVQAYAALCREAGYTPASVALAWVLQNENVSSAIVGASRPEQIAENVKALDIVLEPDFVEAIEKALEPTTLFDPGFTFSPDPALTPSGRPRAQPGAPKREVNERTSSVVWVRCSSKTRV